MKKKSRKSGTITMTPEQLAGMILEMAERNGKKQGTSVVYLGEMKIARLAHPHKRGCRAIEHLKAGLIKDPWSNCSNVIKADHLGRRNNGSVPWLKVRCKDAGCPGERWINLGIIQSAREG